MQDSRFWCLTPSLVFLCWTITQGQVAAGNITVIANSNTPQSIEKPAQSEAAPSPQHLNGFQLIQIGDFHEVQRHFEEALPYYRQALTAFRAANDRLGEATALIRVGKVLRQQGQHPKAYHTLKNASSILSDLRNETLEANAMLELGYVAQSLGRYPEAIDAYRQASTLFEKMQDHKNLTESQLQLGILWSRQDQTGKGLVILEQALQSARGRNDHVQTIRILRAVGENHSQRGQFSVAQDYYREALHLATTQRHRHLEAALEAQLAYSYEKSKAYPQAIAHVQKAIGFYQAEGQRDREADLLSFLGDLHRAQGDIEQAIHYHEQALAISQALLDFDRAAESRNTIQSLRNQSQLNK